MQGCSTAPHIGFTRTGPGRSWFPKALPPALPDPIHGPSTGRGNRSADPAVSRQGRRNVLGTDSAAVRPATRGKTGLGREHDAIAQSPRGDKAAPHLLALRVPPRHAKPRAAFLPRPPAGSRVSIRLRAASWPVRRSVARHPPQTSKRNSPRFAAKPRHVYALKLSAQSSVENCPRAPTRPPWRHT